VKRSGRDEPIQVVIHMFMKAMLGISLYSYLYLKVAKMLWLSYYPFCFLFHKTGDRAEQVLPGSEGGGGERRRQDVEAAQTMCAHMNKCKHNKNFF
jgi:hypothetical protein